MMKKQKASTSQSLTIVPISFFSKKKSSQKVPPPITIINDDEEDEESEEVIIVPPKYKNIDFNVQKTHLQEAEKTFREKWDKKIIEEDCCIINVQDIRRLRKYSSGLRTEQLYLNDEIINYYLKLVGKRNLLYKEYLPRICIHSSFFYQQLLDHGYEHVKNHDKSFGDYFSKADYLFIPINLHLHWTLVVVDLKKQHIQYYDSLGGENRKCTNLIKEYLVKKQKETNTNDDTMIQWEITYPKDIAQQTNDYDCGVFLLLYTLFISNKHSPNKFSQKDIDLKYRPLILYHITKKKIVDS